MSLIVQSNILLAPLTYYKIGGPAKYFVEPSSLEDLKEISAFIRKEKCRYFVLGAGSNILVRDEGFDGLIIQTADLDKTLLQEADALNVGASVMVIQVLRHCMNTGLSGLELLAGIPGNMGGVFYMNAGTKLGEIKDVVQEITTYDFETEKTRVISKSKLKYTYRKNHFLKPSEIILSGKIKSHFTEPAIIQEKIKTLLDARKKTQPIDKPSCGSVFKNPDISKGLHAWKLITDAGLKGHRIGNAQISEQHANFIVNLGGAKATDVIELIQLAKSKVLEKFNITLEEEVKIL